MSKYRFHLQKYSLGSKIACPSCERPRCFVKYVDEEGVVSFPNEVGKCDHEISCGYHYLSLIHIYSILSLRLWTMCTIVPWQNNPA